MTYSSPSASTCTWANQINNRNFLSGIGFKFNIGRFPKVDFFCNTAMDTRDNIINCNTIIISQRY